MLGKNTTEKGELVKKPLQDIEIPPWNVLNTIYSSFWLQQCIQSHTPIHDPSACIKGSDVFGVSLSQFDSYMSLTDAAALWIDFPVTHIDKKPQRRLWINKLQKRRGISCFPLPAWRSIWTTNGTWDTRGLGQFPHLSSSSPCLCVLRTHQEEQVTCGMSPTQCCASPTAQTSTGKQEKPELGSYCLKPSRQLCWALLIFQRLEPFAKLSNECHAIWKRF